jgi:hypothetical protein
MGIKILIVLMISLLAMDDFKVLRACEWVDLLRQSCVS